MNTLDNRKQLVQDVIDRSMHPVFGKEYEKQLRQLNESFVPRPSNDVMNPNNAGKVVVLKVA